MIDIRRAMIAARTGFNTAIRTYRASDHIADADFTFTSYEARLARYYHNARYADNTIYSEINTYANLYKEKERLYKGIRGLRNPINRLNKVEAASVFGGVIDYEGFNTGAIVIKGADDILLNAIGITLKWSNADTMKTLYVREGSAIGENALKVVDDVSRGKVRIEILDPRKVFDVIFDAVGNVKSIDIRYARLDELTKKWYDYRETIDKDWFRTYRDGELFAYTTDGNGSGVSKWENPYGFVPVQWTPHVATKFGFGITSYSATRHKIDNLNDLATLLHDNIRKSVNTKWAVFGDKPTVTNGKPDVLQMANNDRDKSGMIYFGKDSNIKPMVYDLDIEGGLAAVMSQELEVERDLPQLALSRMRDNTSSLSGVAIENLYADAVGIISEIQGTYGSGLTQAIQMAISIGGFRRYDGFRTYNLDSFDTGVIDFQIQPRSLFRDVLSTQAKLELTIAALESKAPALLLEQLDYGEDDIRLITEGIERASSAIERSNARSRALGIIANVNQDANASTAQEAEATSEEATV